MANQTVTLNVSDEMKLENDRQNLCEELSSGELCSSSSDTTEELYSSSEPDTRRVRSIAVKSTELNTEKGLKIRHFRELEVRFVSALLDNNLPLLCNNFLSEQSCEL